MLITLVLLTPSKSNVCRFIHDYGVVLTCPSCAQCHSRYSATASPARMRFAVNESPHFLVAIVLHERCQGFNRSMKILLMIFSLALTMGISLLFAPCIANGVFLFLLSCFGFIYSTLITIRPVGMRRLRPATGFAHPLQVDMYGYISIDENIYAPIFSPLYLSSCRIVSMSAV